MLKKTYQVHIFSYPMTKFRQKNLISHLCSSILLCNCSVSFFRNEKREKNAGRCISSREVVERFAKTHERGGVLWADDSEGRVYAGRWKIREREREEKEERGR